MGKGLFKLPATLFLLFESLRFVLPEPKGIGLNSRGESQQLKLLNFTCILEEVASKYYMAAQSTSVSNRAT